EVGVEVVVAVREDVEPRQLLVGDHRGDRVEMLLAELDVAQRRRVWALEQVPRVPGRPRPGPGHRGREDAILRRCQHAASPLLSGACSVQVDRLYSPARTYHAPGAIHYPEFMRPAALVLALTAGSVAAIDLTQKALALS